ncbi:MAG: hypothetical protein PUC00_02710 [Clostridiales bacterium]|nr:hypothetical protein [Clostridiales bacterium]
MRFKRLFLCLTALLLCTAMALADTLFVTTQNEDTVNMHSGAGTQYEILMRIPNGYGVETNEALDPDRWMLCTYEEQQGYIDGRYLSEVPSAINGYEVSGCMATVKPSTTNGYVNFREKPSTNAKVLYRCHKGDELIELRSNGTWSLVYDTSSCDRGFIQSRFLEYGEPIALADIAFLLADTASMIPPEEIGSTPTSSGSAGASLSGAALVQCDLCGGWYEAGNEFRNHICSGAN